ncbi:MAG: RNA methyltransferase [Flavobacteriales bacterium]
MSNKLDNGFFGIGIENAKNAYNLGTLWRSAFLMGASFIFTVNNRIKKQSSDTSKAWTKIPYYHYESIEDLVNHLPFSCRLVGVELNENSESLHTYNHPSRVVYLLGSEDSGLSKIAENACHQIIKIPSVEPSSLNVASSGSIIMYDRLSKQL